MFGSTRAIKRSTANQHQSIILTRKHGEGSVTIRSCFTESGPGPLTIIAWMQVHHRTALETKNLTCEETDLNSVQML